jgi:primosomal protein N' (replication factor Y) (superfamily II helicase)
MNEFVDVAIPVGVRKTFAYSVPPEFREKIAAGVRLMVPFGGFRVPGSVVKEIPNLKPETGNPKPETRKPKP